MGGFNQYALIKFKEGVGRVQVEELMEGLEKMVLGIDLVKSFEWGKDIETPEEYRQGFTHAFLITFKDKEDYEAFEIHPNHVEYKTKFAAVYEKMQVLNFPSKLVKAPA